MDVKRLLPAMVAAAALAACGRAPEEPAKEASVPTKPDSKPDLTCADCVSEPAETPRASELSDAEWRRRLTPEQYRILRQGGTEPSGSGEYLHHQEPGVYVCAGCGLELYDSKTKYDACGWPSFWDAKPGAVKAVPEGFVHEAVCAGCNGHLGHVFDDGPPPTGKRH